MFQHQKKDYFSVNNDIAIEANQQQRAYENQQMAAMMQAESGYANGLYDDQNSFAQTQQNALSSEQHEGMDEQQYQQMQYELQQQEQMGGPQLVRYDEVYYPRTDKRAIRGNQYTYQGNKFQKTSSNVGAVQEAVNMTILNQEMGKSPIEYTNQLSRAKIYDMKGLKIQDNVRSYSNLYQDSLCTSQYHELQRYGKRAEGMMNMKQVKKATYVNKIEEQPDEGHLQQQQQQEQIPQQEHREPTPGDDQAVESAETEPAENPSGSQVEEQQPSQMD